MSSELTLDEPNNDTVSLDQLTLGSLLRHELLYILWAMMELAIIVPLILAFAPWAIFWPPGVVTVLLLLLMLVPFNLSRLTSMFNVSVDTQRIIMVFTLLAMLLIAWRTLLYEPESILDISWLGQFFDHVSQGGDPLWSRDLMVFVMVVIVWWRGISLVGRRTDIGDVGLRFRVGILLVVFLVAGLAGSQLRWPVTPFILLYFFVSLMAIILTRVEQLERSRSGDSFPIGFRWLVVVTGAGALVTLTIGLISGFISGNSVKDVLGWFSPLWQAMGFLVASALMSISILSTPILAALGGILTWIIGLLGPAFQLGLHEIQLFTQRPLAIPTPEDLSDSTGTVNLVPRQLLPLLIMLFVVLLVALALTRIFLTIRQTAKSETDLASPRAGFDRLGKISPGHRILKRLGLWRQWRTAASIRHIYREMCRMATDHGYPRADFETPYEYLTTLERAWPNNRLDTIIITEAFIRVRYGEIPETQEEFEEIRTAWKILEGSPPEEISLNPGALYGQ